MFLGSEPVLQRFVGCDLAVFVVDQQQKTPRRFPVTVLAPARQEIAADIYHVVLVSTRPAAAAYM
jgi:hypothetical protein